MEDMMNGQDYTGQVPAQPTQPSTTPELEQILVKLQEIDTRVGDVEMKIANLSGGINEDTYTSEEQLDKEEEEEEKEEDEKKTVAEKYKLLKKRHESLRKRLREQGELTGVPEIEQDEKKVSGDASANMEVPNAQTSKVNDDGTKTGAPVAGKETDDKMSKDAEEEGTSEVPEPKKEFPKQAIVKNSLGVNVGEITDGTAKDPTTTADAGKEAPTNPEEMEDEDGKKVPKSMEEVYKQVKKEIRKEDLNKYKAQEVFRERMKKFSERRSVIGASRNDGNYAETKQTAANTIKKYLKISNVRI